MAYLQCAGPGLEAVQGTGLAQYETMGPGFLPVSEQHERFSIIY